MYKKVTEKDAENKAAPQQILVCKQKIAELRAKEKKRFAGMFDKLSKEVEKVRPVLLVKPCANGYSVNCETSTSNWFL